MRTKKNKKEIKKKTRTIIKNAPEIQGCFLLCFSAILFLSLLSFAWTQESTNLLGLLGHSMGWIFHFLFGLGSYLIAFFLGWLGWRFLFGKSINQLEMKIFFFSLFMISFCMLFSLIEDLFPDINTLIGNTFYIELWKRKLRFHLGGAPFYYIYKDIPYFNLFRIINSMGVAILFGTTLLASLIFFSKIPPSQILIFLKSLWPRREEIIPALEPDIEIPPLPPISEEEDPSRFVKLRIPQVQNEQSLSHSSLLEIQPEKNLKVRPSLSLKEKNEPEDKAAEFLSREKRMEIPDFSPPNTFTTELSEPPNKQGSNTPKKQVIRDPIPDAPGESSIKRKESEKTSQGNFSSYKLPQLQLLTNPKKIDQTHLKKDLKRQAEVLEETLQSFGIEAKVGQINCGPTITSFEVHPSIGVKVQKIKTLENDIALNMEAKSIRIIAPIPGKAAVGIEVPNAQPQEVSFKEMLTAYQQGSQKFHIPILLGKAVNGDYVMSDLTKMPHCIIAGATGSGKSVCINTIVISIVMNAKPDEIKLIMVDPKKVELTPYTRLPHMLAPVITEPRGACAALQWLVKEMEKRYEILKQTGARNIDAFNKRTVNKELEAALDIEIPEKMPFIVGIIDELADLMMVSSSDIETPIARIAQMARAVGIHLILATQRPSREVITGLIKANFPTRISFKVASRVNSQIVLDEIGAESLLGNGDMLFLPPGTSHLVRAQGAYVRDEDINSVVKFICDQAPPNYVIQSFDRMSFLESENGGIHSQEESDPLYSQALDIVLSTGNASTTFLQRKLKLGYARAASIMDQLEKNGIVGPAEGSKPRKILHSRKNLSKESFSDLEEL